MLFATVFVTLAVCLARFEADLEVILSNVKSFVDPQPSWLFWYGQYANYYVGTMLRDNPPSELSPHEILRGLSASGADGVPFIDSFIKEVQQHNPALAQHAFDDHKDALAALDNAIYFAGNYEYERDFIEPTKTSQLLPIKEAYDGIAQFLTAPKFSDKPSVFFRSLEELMKFCLAHHEAAPKASLPIRQGSPRPRPNIYRKGYQSSQEGH
jgi:hypothetical protein